MSDKVTYCEDCLFCMPTHHREPMEFAKCKKYPREDETNIGLARTSRRFPLRVQPDWHYCSVVRMNWEKRELCSKSERVGKENNDE